ncbi:MAG: MGMT family protein [Candidatus Fimivivens sp.]
MIQEKSFFDKVYDVVCRIPRGRVTSYGQVALLCGNPRAARAVGWALHQNPRPGEIPCHRVVNRVGRLAPEFAFGGAQEQRRLLEAEQVVFLEDGCVDLTKTFWYGE